MDIPEAVLWDSYVASVNLDPRVKIALAIGVI